MILFKIYEPNMKSRWPRHYLVYNVWCGFMKKKTTFLNQFNFGKNLARTIKFKV